MSQVNIDRAQLQALMEQHGVGMLEARRIAQREVLSERINALRSATNGQVTVHRDQFMELLEIVAELIEVRS